MSTGLQALSISSKGTFAALKQLSLPQGKIVDEIINEWNVELENRSRAFVKQAEALAQWDYHILANRHTLLELEEQLRKARPLKPLECPFARCMTLQEGQRRHGKTNVCFDKFWDFELITMDESLLH